MTFRSNRYGQRTDWNGLTFRSKLEVEVAQRLPPGWSYEDRRLYYVTEHTYTPDFILPNGVILEVKGYWSPEDRAKILAVREQHPELDIRMVFHRPASRISRRSATTYGSWCERKGIQYCAADDIPQSWLE